MKRQDVFIAAELLRAHGIVNGFLRDRLTIPGKFTLTFEGREVCVNAAAADVINALADFRNAIEERLGEMKVELDEDIK